MASTILLFRYAIIVLSTVIRLTYFLLYRLNVTPTFTFVFIILFQNILIYTFLNNTYYIHLLYILREREKERERERERERFYTILFVSHYFAYIQLSALSGLLIWSGVNLHLFL